MELAGQLPESMYALDTVVTDFKECDVWAVPRRKRNSSMHTVPRHTLSAIHSIPRNVWVSMDSYRRLIELTPESLVWYKDL